MEVDDDDDGKVLTLPKPADDDHEKLVDVVMTEMRMMMMVMIDGRVFTLPQPADDDHDVLVDVLIWKKGTMRIGTGTRGRSASDQQHPGAKFHN